ncbi:MAG: type II toxin-antitoxin system Phd/YefM family antitoxin [Thermodesulfobacteriota bacterium]
MIEYSIAEAKNHLPKIVHEVEQEGAVQLTRRGRPVAVILSGAEYERLLQDRTPRVSLMETIGAWRREIQGGFPEVSREEVETWRDRAPGRGFEWPE